MEKNKKLKAIRIMEDRLKRAEPSECGKLTKELVKFKNDWI